MFKGPADVAHRGTIVYTQNAQTWYWAATLCLLQSKAETTPTAHALPAVAI